MTSPNLCAGCVHRGRRGISGSLRGTICEHPTTTAARRLIFEMLLEREQLGSGPVFVDSFVPYASDIEPVRRCRAFAAADVTSDPGHEDPLDSAIDTRPHWTEREIDTGFGSFPTREGLARMVRPA